MLVLNRVLSQSLCHINEAPVTVGHEVSELNINFVCAAFLGIYDLFSLTCCFVRPARKQKPEPVMFTVRETNPCYRLSLISSNNLTIVLLQFNAFFDKNE